MKKYLWAALLELGLLLQAAAADYTLLPVAGGNNLRVPPAMPVAGGANDSKCVNFDTVSFTYDFAGYFKQNDWSLELFVRELPRRQSKNILRLSSRRGDELTLSMSRAAQGRVLSLECGAEHLELQKDTPIGVWKKLLFTKTGDQLSVSYDGKKLENMSVPANFSPQTLTVYASMVDEVKLTGPAGNLVLDWEKDYTAKITTVNNTGTVAARLYGFDNFVISLDPSERDFPMLELVNAANEPRTVTVRGDIKSEINQIAKTWEYQVELAPGSELREPLKFPMTLANDIYHMNLSVDGLTNPFAVKQNFMYIGPRSDAKGPGCFGLHDGDNNVFGFWPEAIPLRYAHKYLYWGYVQGPAWEKDWDGNYGLDPAIDPAEWNWNPMLDWEINAGRRELYVCIQSNPLNEWYRSKEYDHMQTRPWGKRGGCPDFAKYAKFVAAAGKHYQGKVRLWEVDNEPNTYHSYGNNVGDYAQSCKVVYQNLKAADPANFVYIICGTCNFVPWMQKVFEAGGGKYADGISWHTYTTPNMADGCAMPQMLEDAVKATPPNIRKFINSECGVLCIPRFEPDRPIAPDEVKKHIAAKTPGFSSAQVWPGPFNDEYTAAASHTRNAVINFLNGAKGFVFFGWNQNWPKKPAEWQKEDHGFYLISPVSNGEQTPNLLTLACAVMAHEFAGVDLEGKPYRALQSGFVRAGVFGKVDGGEVMAIWTKAPPSSVIIEAKTAELGMTTSFGQRSTLQGVAGADGVFTYPLTFNDLQTVYLHSAKPGMAIRPSPVEQVKIEQLNNQSATIDITLLNRFGKEWQAAVTPGKVTGFEVSPAKLSAAVADKKRKMLRFTVQSLDSAAVNRRVSIPFAVTMPDGTDYLQSVDYLVRGMIKINDLAGVKIDRVDQAVMGRPSELAALMEPKWWQGPKELSAAVKLSSNSEALTVTVEVHDALFKAPAAWPGVGGSCVELFFDFRSAAEGAGTPPYQDKVWQFLLIPPTEKYGPAKMFCPQLKDKVNTSGFAVAGKMIDGQNYVVTLTIPWQAIGGRMTQFGFDAGVNGPFPDKAERKTQLMLFGTGSNATDAANFGIAKE